MKTRTEDEVLLLLDDEFAWRRKELTGLWADITSAASNAQAARIRAGTALLYAHWEGFVKVAADAYVSYVARRRLQYRNLGPGFLALALRTRLREFSDTDDPSSHIAFIRFMVDGLETRAQLPKLGIIKTGANLNSQRLRAIILTLGLDYAPFELKENLIDNKLLHLRNNIAHGRSTVPTQGDYELLYTEISSLLRNFKDQIANAVTLKSYLKGAHSTNRAKGSA